MKSRLYHAADGTIKAALRLSDGLQIESVLLRPSPRRWTACLSSQAGCALACSFCATGLMGLARDLTADEIVGQSEFWRSHLGGDGPQNLVFMGMGEPLANFENLSRALERLTSVRGGFGPRRIAVSTAGIAPAIDRFAETLPEFPLAISLHAADDETRDRLVPINRAFPLAVLAESLRKYLARSKRRLLVEYVLLKDDNDSPGHARSLVRYVRDLGSPGRVHVNLIDYNPTATRHEPAPEARAVAFHQALRAEGLAATRRRNRGRDVAGACGQLIL